MIFITLMAAAGCIQDAPAAVAARETVTPMTEGDVYTIESYKTPDGCVLEVGGIDRFSDGRLAISTRRGQVWIVENPLAENIDDAKITLFHEGLWEGLGLNIKDDEIYVLQRGEISKLVDLDGDGRCDEITTVANDWGVSGHYHEFAFGLPRDSEDNWWMSLNVSFGDPVWWHGRSTVPYRGWVLRVSPDGEVTPWAMGVRSPNGITIDSKDRLFVTDNQGDWVASSPIYHIHEGAFYGQPKSLDWTDSYRAAGKLAQDEIPPPEASVGREAPAIWIPYKWSRSTGNLFEDTSGGKFGVPAGQFVVAELTNGMILRAGFEEVQGETQGWILPLRKEIGSVNRVFQMPDGTVICGLTNRGWGGRAPADGLMRVRYTGRQPMEIADMKILDSPEPETEDGDYGAYGFELAFSQPVAEDWQPSAENIEFIQYDYDYWWEYGSPERHTMTMEIEEATLSEDRTKLVVRSFDLFPAMCVRIKLLGLKAEGGAPLLHNEIAYTVNQLPSGAKTNAYVSKIVPPPPSRGDTNAGVLRLSWGDPFGQFSHEGWELVDARLNPDDKTAFLTSLGNGALVNTGEDASAYVTKGSFGDAHVHAEFMFPEGGKARVVLPGVGAIELADSGEACGEYAGTPPSQASYTGAGDWQELDIFYRVTREDAPAFLDRVLLNGVAIHEGIEVADGTSERGPIRFEPETLMGLRNLQVKPLDRPSDDGDWTFLDAAETWDDWDVMGDASFELGQDEIVGKGALGFLWTPLEDLGNVTIRARVQVNANGAGAVIVRAQDAPSDEFQGYAVRLNASFQDGALTGSIRAGETSAPVKSELIAPDTWVDLEIDATTEPGSGETLIIVSLNGIEVNRMVDSNGDHAEPGGLAFRCDHDGTVMKLRNVRYRAK